MRDPGFYSEIKTPGDYYECGVSTLNPSQTEHFIFTNISKELGEKLQRKYLIYNVL